MFGTILKDRWSISKRTWIASWKEIASWHDQHNFGIAFRMHAVIRLCADSLWFIQIWKCTEIILCFIFILQLDSILPTALLLDHDFEHCLLIHPCILLKNIGKMEIVSKWFTFSSFAKNILYLHDWNCHQASHAFQIGTPNSSEVDSIRSRRVTPPSCERLTSINAKSNSKIRNTKLIVAMSGPFLWMINFSN